MKRAYTYPISITVASLAGLSLAGCGGGGGAQPAVDPLVGGRAALVQMASGQQQSSTQNLQSAVTLFQEAVTAHPTSAEAEFGYAVALAGEAMQGVDGINASTTSTPPVPVIQAASGSGSGSGFAPPAPPSTGEVPPAPPGFSGPVKPITPSSTVGLIWNFDRYLSNPYTLLDMLEPVTDIRVGLISFYGYQDDATDVAARETLLANLTTASQMLQKVEAQPDFTYALPAPDQSGKSVTIGIPEVYLFDAYVNSVRTSLALSLAYIRDPGGFGILPPSPPVPASTTPPIFTSPGASGGSSSAQSVSSNTSPFASLDANHDGLLEPNEYLPPSPFLTLRSASFLTTAQQAIAAVADRELKGITGVLARPSSGTFLIPNSPAVAAILVNIRDNVAPLIQQAATGAVTLQMPQFTAIPLVAIGGGSSLVAPVAANGAPFVNAFTSAGGNSTPPAPPGPQTVSVTISLAAWFAKPPADLKSFAPTYTLDSIGYPDFNKTIYPDLTFGGLYPNGLPTAFRL